MEYEMKLQPEYYDYIFKGTKRIEIRLNDEKRRKIKLGDIIKFAKEPELKETFKVRVIGLLHYNSFNDLCRDFPIEMLANAKMTKKELIRVLEQFYSKEEQKKNGVLGIRIELLD